MTLREILQNWLDEATGPNPSNNVRRYGLCHYVDFSVWNSRDTPSLEAYYEFTNMLAAEFPDTVTPFGSVEDYFARTHAETQHLNPARLAWVRAYLERTANVENA